MWTFATSASFKRCTPATVGKRAGTACDPFRVNGPTRAHILKGQMASDRKCGYNLTGLTEPRCPECGEGFTLAGTGQTPDSEAESGGIPQP